MRVILAAFGLFTVCAAYAGDASTLSKPLASKPSASQRAFIDPVTNRLRSPTREDLAVPSAQDPTPAAMRAKSASSATPVSRTVDLSNGVVGFYPGQNRNQLKARIGKDGRMTLVCDDVPAKKVQP